MKTNAPWPILTALMVGACGGVEAPPEGSVEEAVKHDMDGNIDPFGNTVTNITISGHVLFDEWRDYGRFGLRQTRNGVNGAHQSLVNPVGSSAPNYLGLRDAKVTLYELDSLYGAEPDCTPSQYVASTTVDADGSWSIAVPVLFDGCGTDSDPFAQVTLQAKVTLEFCDDIRCFSVVDPSTSTVMTSMLPWSETLLSAGGGSSVVVGTNGNLVLADTYFEDSVTPNSSSDIRAEAARNFAGLVDVTRKFHVQYGWPAHVADYGEVYLQFPTTGSTGSTSGTSSIKMLQGQTKNGWVAMHEYGHILDNRVTSFSDNGWGPNSLTPCGNDFSQSPSSSSYVLDTTAECGSWGRNGEKEYKAKAYSEGFADFVVHVTLEGLDATEAPATFLLGCAEPAYDGNALPGSPVTGTLNDGYSRNLIFGCSNGLCVDAAAYPTNVTRALCDWFDDHGDDDVSFGGTGDTLSHSLISMHDLIEDTYLDLGASHVASSGFTICDLVAFHLGQVANDQEHVDLISNNGFNCGL